MGSTQENGKYGEGKFITAVGLRMVINGQQNGKHGKGKCIPAGGLGMVISGQ